MSTGVSQCMVCGGVYDDSDCGQHKCQDKSPREWWFPAAPENDVFGGLTYVHTSKEYVRAQRRANGTNFIHVIEKSAYDKLAAELAAVKDAAEYCMRNKTKAIEALAAAEDGRQFFRDKYEDTCCVLQDLRKELQAERERKCERCGDLFYHPKVMIADAKQHAAEWEDIAKRAEKERDAARAEVERLKEDQKLHYPNTRRLYEERDRLKAALAECRAKLNIAITAHVNEYDTLRQALATAKKERDFLRDQLAAALSVQMEMHKRLDEKEGLKK